MYNNATVIRLSPPAPVASSSGVSRVSSVRSATFEEAFGEYSELRGDRRRRRLERLKRRRERRKARLEARRKKREERKRRKLEKMRARAERKKRLMEMREERKRKKSGEPRESEREDDRKDDLDQPRGEESSDSQEGGASSDSQEGRGGNEEQGRGAQSDSQEGGGYAEEQGGGRSSDEQGGGGSSDEQGGGGSSDEQGGGGSSDDQRGGGSSDDQRGGGDDSGNYSEEQEMGDYDTQDGGEDYSEPFDGIPVDASFSEMDDSGKASKKVQVNPSLQDLVNKIEWNKELVSRLEEKRKKGIANPSEISKSIIDRKKRIGELESQLEMYLGFDSYSMASGMSKQQMKNEIARRRLEVNQARRRARAIRLGSKKERLMAQMTNRKLRAKWCRNHGGDVTPVDVDLKPEIKAVPRPIPTQTESKAVSTAVPVEATSKATGIIGLDDSRDYDSRELDVKLGADGDMPMRQPFSMAEGDFYYGVGGDTTKSSTGRSINWTGVVLGIGAGALAIWAIRKYKLLK